MTQTESPNPVPLVIDRIKEKIRSRIGTEWDVGDRLPSISELARELGSGEKNTYRAVKSLSKEGILASRRRLGTFVMDRPVSNQSHEARDNDGRRKSDKVTHLLINPGRDGMIDQMARAFLDEMANRGREVKVCDEPARVKGAMDFRESDADAIALINNDCSRIVLSPHQALSLINTGIGAPAGLGAQYDLVMPDNEQGGTIAGLCLKAFGIHDVAFVGVQDSGSESYRELDQHRLAGLERGLDCKIPSHRRHYVEAYVGQCGAGFASEYARMSDRPEAVFCATDDIAIGFAIGSWALGLRPRRDYLLFGFDGQSLAANIINGGITTVNAPAFQMGTHAAELLDIRLGNVNAPPRRVALGCTIRRGDTTPAPDNASHPFFDGASYWPSEPEVAGHE